MYVYVRSEPNLFTVGFYDPNGKWHPENDFNDREEAAERAAWLNGSKQKFSSHPIKQGFQAGSFDDEEF